MATQIASTPVVKGKEAVKILKEANRSTFGEGQKRFQETCRYI